MRQPRPSTAIVHRPSSQLMATLRERLRATIQQVIDEGLEDTLGVGRYGRSGTRGADLPAARHRHRPSMPTGR